MRTYGLTFYLYSLLLSTKCPEKIVSLQTKTHESSSAYEKTHPCSPNLLAALFIVSKLLRTDSFIRSRHVSISFAFPDELVLHCAPPAYTSPCVARCACALASSAYGALPCLPYLADTGQCGSETERNSLHVQELRRYVSAIRLRATSVPGAGRAATPRAMC